MDIYFEQCYAIRCLQNNLRNRIDDKHTTSSHNIGGFSW